MKVNKKIKFDFKFLNDKKFLLSFIIFIFLFVVFLFSSFAVLEPVSSVIVQSTTLDNASKVEGSWKYTKSAKWISKGKARLNIKLETIEKKNADNTDVILVLDTSGSMVKDKLTQLQSDVNNLINDTIPKGNKISIITFNDTANIVTEFTDDSSLLEGSINSLVATGETNYYQALVKVDEVLSSYLKEDNRDCVVLFLTDGLPTIETPSEVGEYKLLKDKYEYLNINGIQYELGDYVLDGIKNVTDIQYIASTKTLNEFLYKASIAPAGYDNLVLTDYIDTDYFNLDDIGDITTSFGNASIKNNQVIWNLNGFKTGLDAELTFDINLNDDLVGKGGVYPTNTGTNVNYQIASINTLEETTKTPVLKDNYVVTYDPNTPAGCVVSNVPSSKVYSVFDTVRLDDSTPTCMGYQFKEWKIVTDVEKVSNDQFVMPESNVVIKAIWKSVSLEKSMNGKISKSQTLYKVMADNSRGLDSDIDFSQQPTDDDSGIYTIEGTENDEYPVYYYRGNIDNNNVIFAGFCWKMVRTTSTGGVKMIYNGLVTQYHEGTPIKQDKYINISNDETYPYTYDVETNKWISTNKTNSKTATISFSISEPGTYILSYSISSEANYDKAYFYKDGVQVGVDSGIKDGTVSLGELTLDNIIMIKYTKDSSGSKGTDSVTFSIDKQSESVINSCNNTGTASQIGKSGFSSNNTSLSDVGYMYGVRYPYDYLRAGIVDVLNRYSPGAVSNYYYGSSVTYSNGMYTLDNASQKSWADNYSDLIGYYTCRSNETTCSTVYYIVSSTNSYQYDISLTNGVTDPTTQTITLGKSVTDNGDDTYSLSDVVTISKVDWVTSYSKYHNMQYYMCRDSISTTCTDKNLVWTTDNYRILYDKTFNYVYGSGFSWDGTKYILTDTFVSKDSWANDYKLIGNQYHYTCLSTTSECTNVFYAYYFSDWIYSPRYITLKNGKDLEQAKEEMFTNTNSSKIKQTVDSWYKNNMTDYTEKLEDTVWCNDRTMYGGSMVNRNETGASLFGAYKRKDEQKRPSVICPDKNRDGFTVSTTNGGNGALTYPVGLLTADEVRLSGINDSYLISGTEYWTLSPFSFRTYEFGYNYYVNRRSLLSYYGVRNSYGVRPAISLIPGIRSIDGDGTVNNPYVIEE